MPRLVIIRHAKSSWDSVGQPDRDRPLNARGRRDAPRLGAWLRAAGHVPELALVSTAARTRETWTGLCAALGRDAPSRHVEALYEAGPQTILEAVRGAPSVGTLAVIGHNPGIGEFALRLVDAAPDDPAFWKYPTSATAILETPDWNSLDWGSGRLLAFVTPKTMPPP
jgi:phosphohistidine phosphatase